MKEIKYINEMFNLQQSLNDATCGAGWENGFTKENRLIDFARCIYMECAEFIDSMPWKHWKSINAKWDLENMRIELVDIWHFLLSLAIMQNRKDELILAYEEFDFSKTYSNDFNEILQNSRELIHLTSSKLQDIKQITQCFLTLTMQCELSFERLYKIYIGKNVLNKFRQDNGYKDGTYIKIWNGKEDNVIMQEQLDLIEVSFDNLYKKLDEIYKTQG